ncbi:PAC2 family protein [Candidatus Woesearchaeota archaeon]|nr:PAC2 family protein [Candidatus Woesearchaeota archaeon]MBW3016188.1 PAC2 family protein [Candidatus Woesearchaeota archaeon]
MEKEGIYGELKKIKATTVLEGFPGFGLVSTITTGFLIDHLKCEQIGKYWFEQGQPTIAIHNCSLIDPIGIYYNKKYDLVIVHSIAPATGMEWKAAELVLNIAKTVGAKEIITIEGVGSQESNETRGFFYTSNPQHKKKFEKMGIDCLGEGIIVGVTSALLMKAPQKGMDVCSLFSETHSNLPDSKAAAKIIELLDKYLGLKVDYQPLLKQAAEFEKKLRTLIEQSQKAKEIKEKKDITYVG